MISDTRDLQLTGGVELSGTARRVPDLTHDCVEIAVIAVSKALSGIIGACLSCNAGINAQTVQNELGACVTVKPGPLAQQIDHTGPFLCRRSRRWPAKA